MRELLKTVLLIIAPIVLLFGLVFVLLFFRFTDSFKPTHRQVELGLSGNQSKLYIKTENWGVTGGSQLTIVTTEDQGEFEEDSTRQIIFRGLEPFLYMQANYTLTLFVHAKAMIPKEFKSEWTIIQIEVDNSRINYLRRDSNYKGV